MNKVNSILEKARARVQFALLGKTSVIKISEIPKTWSKFMNTEDLWVNIDFPEEEDTTACMYIGEGEFELHKHDKQCKHITILNKEGHIRVQTKNYTKDIKFPDSVYFAPGEAHYIKFINKTKLLCLWQPKMKGWSGEFISKKQTT